MPLRKERRLTPFFARDSVRDSDGGTDEDSVVSDDTVGERFSSGMILTPVFAE
jgi:hypothetical protein